MSSGYGMTSFVQMSKQNSFNDINVSSHRAISITGETLEFSIEQIQEESMYGRYSQSPSHEGMHKYEGALTAEASAANLGALFVSYFGVDSVDGHKHNFQLQNSDFDIYAATTPFTIEVFRGGDANSFLYGDMVGNTINLNITNGELLTCEVGYIGASFSRDTASTPTYDTDPIPFNWSQSSISFASTAVCEMRELSVTGTKNIEAQYSLCNQKDPYAIKRSDFETAELSGTMIFQDLTFFDAYEAQSQSALTLNFVSNSPNNLELIFPKVKLLTFAPMINAKGLLEVPFTARADYDEATATAMQFNLTDANTIAY